MNLDVHKGYIKTGKVFSDSLIPDFIDEMNDILESPEIVLKYDATGFKKLCEELRSRLQFNENYEMYLSFQIDDLQEHLISTLTE